MGDVARGAGNFANTLGGIAPGGLFGGGTSALPGLVTQTGGGGGGTSGVGAVGGGLGGGIGVGATLGGGVAGGGFEGSGGIPNFNAPAGLAPPPGFDPQTGGGSGGVFGLGQSLGQNFTVEQTQQQQQIAPQQAGGLQSSIRAALQLAANQLDPESQLSTFLGGPGAALPGQGQDFLSGISEAQTGLLGAEDPSIVQGRIDALGTDIRTQLGEAIGGAGGLLTQQALAGNLGGGRSEVAEGIAGRGAVDAFAREAAGIRESAAGRRLQALLGGAEAGRIGVAGAGDVFNLGLAGSQGQFSPLLNLAQIIGDPKVLQQSLQQRLSQGVESGEGTGGLLSGAGSLLTGIGDVSATAGKLFDAIFN